jgi:hypothetical protein
VIIIRWFSFDADTKIIAFVAHSSLLDNSDPYSTNHESKRIRRNLYADDGNAPAAQPGYPVIVAGWAKAEIVNE